MGDTEFGWDSDPEVRRMDNEVSLRPRRRQRIDESVGTAVFSLLSLNYFGDFYAASSFMCRSDSGNIGALVIGIVGECLHFSDIIRLSEVSRQWFRVAAKILKGSRYGHEFDRRLRIAGRRAVFDALNKDYTELSTKGSLDHHMNSSCSSDGHFRISPGKILWHISNGMSVTERILHEISLWGVGDGPYDSYRYSRQMLEPPESYRFGIQEANRVFIQSMARSSPRFAEVRRFWWYTCDIEPHILPWGCNDVPCEKCGQLGSKVVTMFPQIENMSMYFKSVCELCAASLKLRRFRRLSLHQD